MTPDSSIHRRGPNESPLGVRTLLVLALAKATLACDATPPIVNPDDTRASASGDVDGSTQRDGSAQNPSENAEITESFSRPTQGLIPPRQLVAVITEETGMLKREFQKLTQKDTLDPIQNDESDDRLIFDSPKTSGAEELTWAEWLQMALNSPEVQEALTGQMNEEIRKEIALLKERKEKGLGRVEATRIDVILWELEKKKNDVLDAMRILKPERVELIENMWSKIEKHYGSMPEQEAQRKAAALEALVPNYDAFKLLITLEIPGTGGKTLERVTPGQLQPGDEVERHNPCLDGKFGFTVEEQGDRYVDSNGRVYTQEELDSNCKEYDTFYREKPSNEPTVGGETPRSGDVPEEEGDDGNGESKAKINPYVFARYRFGAMSLVDGSDIQNPMQNHALQGGLGIQIGPEEPHIGYAALTLAGGADFITGRPDENTDAPGGGRATAGEATMGFEGNFHLPEKQEWMDLDFMVRAELHALFGPKDLITNKMRLGGGAGLGGGLKWWLGKNSRFGLSLSGGWDHLINPTDHGYNLGEFALERPMVTSNNVYVDAGVLFRFGKKNDEN